MNVPQPDTDKVNFDSYTKKIAATYSIKDLFTYLSQFFLKLFL